MRVVAAVVGDLQEVGPGALAAVLVDDAVLSEVLGVARGDERDIAEGDPEHDGVVVAFIALGAGVVGLGAN